MIRLSFILISAFLLLNSGIIYSQDQQERIDSLVNKLRTAGREWNDFANPLIKIGEPAVPALIINAKDKNLSQWNRRISIITLNNIHSAQWKKPALQILFDENEDPELRNHVTAGLTGFDLSNEKTRLWKLYNKTGNQFYKSNLACLLITADTSLAYQAFKELYNTQDGHLQKNALLQLTKLRPDESAFWFLKGIQNEDWMTANLAMDSLVASSDFKAEELIEVYERSGSDEKVQWRIVYIFGHRKEPGVLDFLFNALENESWLVHNEAAVGLIRFEPEQVLPRVKILEHDSRKFVRQNAKWVINHFEKNL